MHQKVCPKAHLLFYAQNNANRPGGIASKISGILLKGDKYHIKYHIRKN